LKPVTQTRTGRPLGNCWAAAIASILELPIEAVDWSADMTAEQIEPDPAANDTSDEWQERRKERLRALGYWESFIEPTQLDQSALPPWVHYVVLGDNVEGGHAVVFRAGQLAHDPNPKQHGVDEIAWLVFLVRA
jgi:hypothetical protein